MAWRTTNDPRTVFVTIRLTVGEAADLDALASAQNVSRSKAARSALARVIASEKRKRASK